MQNWNQSTNIYSSLWISLLKYFFMITSIPVITNEGKFVVELLKDVTNTFLVEGIDIENISDTYEKINRLNDLVVKDELTGIFNRRFIK
ncbi:hypothetical protein [Caldicellulosiruptor acetigenus]|uniref:hypothetical protein n=2 Tax=Caldicellulosiruptor acetigenus TaxID=301953 RepID=UPI0011D0B07E|nr:hypothetical protein [Caldicellulosiruptor acetigenus]